MQAYRIETTVVQDGELLLHELPLKVGERVEVIVLRQETSNGKRANGVIQNASPLSSQSESLRRRQQVLAELQNGLFSRLLKPGDLLPSEEFARRKAEEKALEERRWTA